MRKAQKSSASGSAKPPTTPCCSKVGLKRGPWTKEEDEILSCFVASEGEGRWRTLPKRAGLLRCGKSCRLRWMNYLRPSIKHGQIAPDEEDLIIRLHRLLGNRWSLIAGRIPGRTDNEIKNYWNTHLSKKLISQGINPRTHKPLNSSSNPNPREKVPPATPPNITITTIPNYTYSNPSSGTSYIPPAGVNFDHNNIYDHREFLGGAELSRGTSGIDNSIDDVFTSFCDSLINVDMFMQQEQQHLSQGGSGNHDSNTNQWDSALPFASGYEIGSIWSTPLSPVVSLDGDIDAQFMDHAGK